MLRPDGSLSARGEQAIANFVAGSLLAQGKRSQIIVWESNAARAFVTMGEWVAECPRPECSNVEFLTDKDQQWRGKPGVEGDRRQMFACSYCGFMTQLIEWPPDADQIMAVLDRRPMPHNRSWYPEGHII